MTQTNAAGVTGGMSSPHSTCGGVTGGVDGKS